VREETEKEREGGRDEESLTILSSL
jgi:hypothetical protein